MRWKKLFSLGLLISQLLFPAYSQHARLAEVVHTLQSQPIDQPENTYYLSAMLGGGVMVPGQNAKNLRVNSTYTNRYASNQSVSAALLVGLGVGQQFIPFNTFAVDIGLSGYYLHFSTQKGTLSPGFNSTLNLPPVGYSFNANSALFFGEMHWYFYDTVYRPLIYFGMGLAWNILNQYHDPLGDTSTFKIPFQNHTSLNFSAGLGIGVSRFSSTKHCWSLEYRYLYLGPAHIGQQPAQTHRQLLKMGILQAHLILFSVYLHP